MGNILLTLKVVNSVIFQVFPCTTQIALFLPKLLPALFLKKPRYPCPFEILEEALEQVLIIGVVLSNVISILVVYPSKWEPILTGTLHVSTLSCLASAFKICGANNVSIHMIISVLSLWRETCIII
jgi:hypothetical protein